MQHKLNNSKINKKNETRKTEEQQSGEKDSKIGMKICMELWFYYYILNRCDW